MRGGMVSKAGQRLSHIVCSTGLALTTSLGLAAAVGGITNDAAAQQIAYVGSADGDFQLSGYRPGRHRCQGCPQCQGVRPCPADNYVPSESVTPDAPLPEGAVESEGAESATPDAMPDIEQYTEPSTSGLASSFGSASSGGSMAVPMIGDFVGTPIAIPISGMTGPNAPLGGSATFSNPFLARTFKVVEGQSPVPQNRVYGRYNLFNRIDNNNADLSRYVIGFERTFLDGNASFGMLLPFYSVNQGLFAQPAGADPVGPLGFGSNSGSAGDLTMIFKGALYQNPQNGSVISVGLTVTAPTGPNTIAGIQPAFAIANQRHWGTIQPWWGFLKNFDNTNWFIQGYSAIDQPFYRYDTTLMFNDLAFGYYYKRDPDSWITALVPTFEAHATTPLGNRTAVITPIAGSGIFFSDTTAQVGNQLNLTTGVTALVRRKTALTLGVVAPVVGPQPFDWELQLQLTYFPFGTGRLPGPRFVPFN